MANIELDGSNKKIKVDSGDLTLDIPGDIILDADGGDVTFADGGTNIASLTNSSSSLVIESKVSDNDIIFKVNDGGSSTEVARFDGDVSALKIASGKKLMLGAAEEYISGDGTDITFAVGSSGDINVPANIGLTFGDDGEKIEGDGTDLTISGNNINLTAVADVVIPNNVGIQFGGASEKIEGDGTDMTISANNLTVDAAADITLDAGGNNFKFSSGGTQVLDIANSSSDVIIKPTVDAKDVIFQQYDGNEVMRINDSRKLQFYDDGGESITSDGSKLIIESGGTTFNLPSADGSDGQFLKTNGSGTLSFAAAGSDFVRLGEVGGSSATAAVTFDNVFDGSTYQMYRLIGQISPAVNANLYFKWRTGSSGSNATYTTSDYVWKMVGHYIDDAGNVGGYDVGGYPEAYFNLSNDMKSDSNSAMTAFDLYIADPDTNLFSRSMITGTVGWHENTGNQQIAAAFSARNTANVNATGLTLVMGSNNITWHRVQLWGYKRA